MATPPDIPELTRHAISCVKANNLVEAERLYTRICEIESHNSDAWMMLGRIYANTGNPVQAENCFRLVVNLNPSGADAHNRLAAALMVQGRLDEAEESCRNALSINPGRAEIVANLGNVLGRQGRLREAATCYRQALQADPGFIGAYLNLGNSLRALGEYIQAADVYKKVLEINPGYIEIYNAIGECYLEAGMPEKSLECYRDAIRMQPGYVQAHINMGFVQAAMKNYSGALECYRHALEIEPGRADVHLSRGLVEKKLGQFREAASSYRQALALKPDDPDTQLALSLVELTQGNFSTGWKLYAARKSIRGHHFDAPVHLDENMSGQRILVIKDQGIGDEIFFLRFVRELKDRGAWVAYMTDPKIKSVISRLSFLDEVFVADNQAPECGLRLSAGDLPLCLGFNDHTQVSQAVELSPLQSSIDKVRSILDAIGPGPYVGTTWWAGTRRQGRLQDDQLAYREVPIDLVAGVLQPLQSTVLVLQRDPGADEISRLSELLGRPVHDLSRFNDDLEGMLALLYLLDEYIGVDNTNMHLCASIGKGCRILVPHPPEWRMGVAGTESPWFSGSTLYRQTAAGDWSPAVNRIGADLAIAMG